MTNGTRHRLVNARQPCRKNTERRFPRRRGKYGAKKAYTFESVGSLIFLRPTEKRYLLRFPDRNLGGGNGRGGGAEYSPR